MATVFEITKKVSPYYCYSTIGIRVRLECTAAPKLSSKIFAYAPDSSGVEPIYPSIETGYTESNGKFNHVCNVIDMIECPEDEPSPGKWPIWFRRDYVDLLLPNIEVAYDFIQKVEEDVNDLYNNMKRYNKLITEGSIIVDNGEIETPTTPTETTDDTSETDNEGDDANNG